jgi:hypothetical protein
MFQSSILDIKINFRLRRPQKDRARVRLVDAIRNDSVQDLSSVTTIRAAPPSDDVLGRSGSIARRARAARPSRLRRLGTFV